MAAESTPAPRGSRGGASKYDYVKVRVWLRDPAIRQDAHYYVLSRFLVSRVLAVTQMAYRDAIRLALELKKQLVDAQRLDLTQGEMEAALFTLMRANGYGGAYIRRFRMMSAFNQQRTPLVILVSGTGLIGKSTVATLLAERLNLPNILQTELLHALLVSTHAASTAQPPPPQQPAIASVEPPQGASSSVANGSAASAASAAPGSSSGAASSAAAPAQLHPGRVWSRRFGAEAELLARFDEEVGAVRHGMQAELDKVMHEGKRTIIEGIHLDLALYEEALGDGCGRHGVVVPFVLKLSDDDLALALHHHLASDPPPPAAAEAATTVIAATGADVAHEAHDGRDGRDEPLPQRDLLAQLSTVQRHLEARAACCARLRPHVVQAALSSVETTLDVLHTHVLESIEAFLMRLPRGASHPLEAADPEGESWALKHSADTEPHDHEQQVVGAKGAGDVPSTV